MNKILIILFLGVFFLVIGVSCLFWPQKAQEVIDRYDKAGRNRRIPNFEFRVVGALALCGFFTIVILLIRHFW